METPVGTCMCTGAKSTLAEVATMVRDHATSHRPSGTHHNVRTRVKQWCGDSGGVTPVCAPSLAPRHPKTWATPS